MYIHILCETVLCVNSFKHGDRGTILWAYIWRNVFQAVLMEIVHRNVTLNFVIIGDNSFEPHVDIQTEGRIVCQNFRHNFFLYHSAEAVRSTLHKHCLHVITVLSWDFMATFGEVLFNIQEVFNVFPRNTLLWIVTSCLSHNDKGPWQYVLNPVVMYAWVAHCFVFN
jgi:hypothetical protein